MSWIYSQTSGNLWNPDGQMVGTGYSGYGDGKNNPKMQHVRDVGPIPQGWYLIRETTTTCGPITVVLEPLDPDVMFDRNNMRMHGQTAKNMGKASKGCIIQPPLVRKPFSEAVGKMLRVVE